MILPIVELIEWLIARQGGIELINLGILKEIKDLRKVWPHEALDFTPWLAETIGTTGQYVNRIIKKQDGVVNKTFVQMLEALGYDIELTYVKRKCDTTGDTF